MDLRRSALAAGLALAGGLSAAGPAHAAAGPVVTVKAAGSYYPVHDGYQDVFGVTLTTDEQATAHLFLRKGSRIVARGVKALDEDAPTTVTAGAGLRPGAYTWDLAITDVLGNTTTTPLRTVVADGRRLVPATRTATVPATKLAATLRAGTCATARRTGAGVTLATALQCASQGAGADTATASLTFPLAAGVTYGPLTVTLKSTGNDGVFTAFQGATQQVADSHPLASPSAVIPLPGSVIGAGHTLRFTVTTGAGEKLTLQSVTVRAVVNTLR